MISDPIANMFSSINNANTIRKHNVKTPLNKIKVAILEILKKEGFVRDYKVDEENHEITINLLYVNGEQVLTKIRRVSKCGLRIYKKHNELPIVLNHAGLAIISTCKGLMTNKEAFKKRQGGEIIAEVW